MVGMAVGMKGCITLSSAFARGSKLKLWKRNHRIRRILSIARSLYYSFLVAHGWSKSVLELDKYQDIKLPERYIWLSRNQMIDLIYKQRIDIEARLLFGIINFKETI